LLLFFVAFFSFFAMVNLLASQCIHHFSLFDRELRDEKRNQSGPLWEREGPVASSETVAGGKIFLKRGFREKDLSRWSFRLIP
jgi:hypothetical protein